VLGDNVWSDKAAVVRWIESSTSDESLAPIEAAPRFPPVGGLADFLGLGNVRGVARRRAN